MIFLHLVIVITSSAMKKFESRFNVNKYRRETRIYESMVLEADAMREKEDDKRIAKNKNS